MYFDSSMDNLPTYTLLKDRHISAFIDLNSKCGPPKTIPDTIAINKNGTPIYQEGLCMVPNGYDKSKGQLMWRCPFGKEHACKCINSCSSAKYGRVINQKPIGITTRRNTPLYFFISLIAFTLNGCPHCRSSWF
jgi:hypothetical protein